MDANKTAGEEARRQLHKNAACNLEQVLATTPHQTPTVRPPASYHERSGERGSGISVLPARHDDDDDDDDK